MDVLMWVLQAGPALSQQTGSSESLRMAQVPSLTFLKLYLEKKEEDVLMLRLLKLAKGWVPHKTL